MPQDRTFRFTSDWLRKVKPESVGVWYSEAGGKGLRLYVGTSGKKTWYIDYRRLDGKKAQYKIGDADLFSVSQARDAVLEFLAAVNRGETPWAKSESPPEELVLEALIRDYYGPWVIDNRRGGAATLAMLRNAFADFMALPISTITPLQIEQWRVKYRKEQNIKAATINRYITTLKAALNWGLKHKIIDSNPVSGMESMREEDSKSNIRYLSKDENKRLFAALDARETTIRTERASHNQWCVERKQPLLPDLSQIPFADHLKPIVLISINTGIRRKALFSLLWGDVDFEHKTLILRQETDKTEQDDWRVNLNKIALSTFEKWRSQSVNIAADALVFPSPKTNAVMDNCKSAWAGVLKAADIKNFRWHDMRHDFASQLVMKGVDLNTVRELMGHSDLKMTLRYAHLAPSIKQAAVELLG